KQRGFPGTYDFVSGFYRARALPLSDGGIYNFSVRGEGTDYQAELRVIGREVIRTNVGSFPAIVTQIKVPGSPLRSLKIYFSDDAGHVPVLIVARLSAGELRAELAASELIRPPAEAPTPTPPIIAAPRPTPAGPLPLSSNLPFKLGEELNYQVFIEGSNTPLGLASFQVHGRSKYFERDGVFLSVTAQTTGAGARIFVAKDQIDSYVDPKSLLPYRTSMNLAEGERRLNQILTFGQDTGMVTSDKGARIEVPVGTHDYVSFFYVVRTLTFVSGKKNAISILVENKPKTIFVTALPRESIQPGPRRVQAIPVKLTTDDPDPDKYQFRMWLSDDHQRLPLRITCNTKLGPLRADLAILPLTSQ